MCACVLKKTLSNVRKLIGDRDYVPCRDEPKTSSSATLGRLVLRKQQRNFFSRHIKGPYKYEVLPMSLSDYGVLIPSDELDGDAAASVRPSLLNGDFPFTEKLLGEYRLDFVTVAVLPPLVATLDDNDKIRASGDTSASASTSLSSLKVSRIEGSDLELLISELQSKWRFNKDHHLWKDVKRQDELELCFVSSIVSTKEGLTLQCKHGARGGLMALLEKFIERSLVAPTTSSHFLVIPADTALAYKVQQLAIDPNSGRITVPLGKMATADDEGTPIDPDKEIEDCRLYYSEFFGRLSREKQTNLRKALIKKFLSLGATLPTGQSLDEGQGSMQLELNSGDASLPTDDNASKYRRLLKPLKKMAKAALPTDADPKEKAIADLLQELGGQGLLDPSTERSAVYGIRYFITALLQLSPEVLLLLFERAAATAYDDDRELAGFEIVSALEYWIEKKADGTECETWESFSLDTALGDDSFLYAWRAAYVAAIYMFGLTEA